MNNDIVNQETNTPNEPIPVEQKNKVIITKQGKLEIKSNSSGYIEVDVQRIYHNTGRNSLCPCGSNKKFKKCCIVRYVGKAYIKLDENSKKLLDR